MHWYDDRSCSVCNEPLARGARRGRPLLRDAAGATVEPHHLAAAEVAALLATHAPICWQCNLTLAFQPRDAGTMRKTAAPPPNGNAGSNRPWWEAATCEVCHTVIGRLRFWKEKPRLLASDGVWRDVRYVGTEQAQALRPTHRLVCAPCYHNRYADALLLAKTPRDAAPERP